MQRPEKFICKFSHTFPYFRLRVFSVRLILGISGAGGNTG